MCNPKISDKSLKVENLEGYGYFAAWGIHEKRTNIKPAPFYGSRLPEG